jgi:hypothetical protein
LFEGPAEQTVAYFNEEEVPLSLAVVFDSSGSMADQLPGARKAVAALLQNVNPEDEFSPAIADQISKELRSEYVLGYVPSSTGRDGRVHQVRLQVQSQRAPKTSVFWAARLSRTG